MACYDDGVRKDDNSRQGRSIAVFLMTKEWKKQRQDEFHIPLPRLTTKNRIILSLFTGGQNNACNCWTKWSNQLGTDKCKALPKVKTEGAFSNLWVWKLAHLFDSKSVNKRQTNNLRTCFMRKIFLNVFDEKVLTELKVDLRCVRRMNEPNQSGFFLANKFKPRSSAG